MCPLGDGPPRGLLAVAFELFQQAFGGPRLGLGQGRQLKQALGAVTFVGVRRLRLLVVEFKDGVDKSLHVRGGDLQLLHGGVQVRAEPGHARARSAVRVPRELRLGLSCVLTA